MTNDLITIHCDLASDGLISTTISENRTSLDLVAKHQGCVCDYDAATVVDGKIAVPLARDPGLQTPSERVAYYKGMADMIENITPVLRGVKNPPPSKGP